MLLVLHVYPLEQSGAVVVPLQVAPAGIFVSGAPALVNTPVNVLAASSEGEADPQIPAGVLVRSVNGLLFPSGNTKTAHADVQFVLQ